MFLKGILRKGQMSRGKTYENWLVSLDSDNFSMFVKTWFAFLASVRELVLAQAREEEKATLVDAHGDKKFLESYKKGLSSIELTQIMQDNILEAFASSREVVRAEYPEYYFQTYYKKIAPFSFCKKESISLGGLQYKFDVDVRTDSLFFGILVESEKVSQKLQSKYIRSEIPISLLPGTMIDNQGDFYAHIKARLQDGLFKQIRSSIRPVEADRIKKNLAALCQFLVSQHLSSDAGGVDLYNSTFHVWCDEHKIVDMDLKEWFIGFCYSLRNVLFHRTIDPFDNRWSGVMKSCYQGLREFLLANIKILSEMEV